RCSAIRDRRWVSRPALWAVSVMQRSVCRCEVVLMVTRQNPAGEYSLIGQYRVISPAGCPARSLRMIAIGCHDCARCRGPSLEACREPHIDSLQRLVVERFVRVGSLAVDFERGPGRTTAAERTAFSVEAWFSLG